MDSSAKKSKVGLLFLFLFLGDGVGGLATTMDDAVLEEAVSSDEFCNGPMVVPMVLTAVISLKSTLS